MSVSVSVRGGREGRSMEELSVISSLTLSWKLSKWSDASETRRTGAGGATQHLSFRFSPRTHLPCKDEGKYWHTAEHTHALPKSPSIKPLFPPQPPTRQAVYCRVEDAIHQLLLGVTIHVYGLHLRQRRRSRN